MRNYKILKTLAVILSLAANLTHAAVVIDNVFTGQYVPGTYVSDSEVTGAVTSYTINATDLTGASFGASGNDKLVLSIHSKWASSPGGAVTSLTYGGATMSNVFDSSLGETAFSLSRQEIWYLDDVSADGDISFTFDDVVEGFAIYLFALDGTKAGGPQDSATEGASVNTPSLATSVADSFVFWEVGDNRGTPSYSGTYSTDAQRFGGRGGSRALWNIEGSGGTFSETVSDQSNSTGTLGVLFEAAVPEPSTAALLVVSLGALALRRRR